MKPSIKKEIGRIIWFDQCKPNSQWTNYGMDCLSADYILQTEIPVYRIMAGEKSVKYSEELHKEIGQLNTPYAQSIYRAHDIDTIQKKIAETHLGIWDDLAALYYLNPELFKNDTSMADTLGRVMIVKEDVNVKEKIIQVLHTYFKDMNQVFSPFPTDTTYYQDDIKHFTDSIIKLYGLREWKAMVLTNEIHSHLGLYSIIGTKMGIRSLEYFRARQGELNITSFAGKETPLSCLNDGLQVATGSTVGNGQFILEGNQQTPRATIVCEKSGKIEIKLKTQFYNKIQQEIIKAKNMHPNFSDKYWETIRKKAVDIWQNWDRKEIFEINNR
jgi:pyrimidine-specific ribonucleoside hydrolase